MMDLSLITVITADVVNSKRAGDVRQTLQERADRVVSPLLAWPFKVSRGDEIQGVCRGVLAAPEIVRHLVYQARPFLLRLGLGIGPAPSERAASPWELSGEAFFRAREALENRRDKHASIRLVSGDARLDLAADAVFTLMDTIWSRWTREQWDAVMAYERDGTYEAAGATLGIALQNVEKRCRAARWYAVRAGEEALRGLGRFHDVDSPRLG